MYVSIYNKYVHLLKAVVHKKLYEDIESSRGVSRVSLA